MLFLLIFRKFKALCFYVIAATEKAVFWALLPDKAPPISLAVGNADTRKWRKRA
jgi:hypothetical protein